MASGSLRNCIARFALLFHAVGCIWLILHSTEHYRNDHNGIVSLNCPLVVIELTGEKKTIHGTLVLFSGRRPSQV